jgi:hypothetical protein
MRPRHALAALLVAGAVLRLLFVFAWQPGFMGWPDAASYIDVSQSHNLFSNELRPAGYPLFLHLLHGIAPSLTFVIVLQHLLGLATAALLYLAVGRSGVPRAWGLLPAAVVALGGDWAFLEHAAISESLFMFLVAAALYAGVRTIGGERLVWPAAGGLLLVLAATVRVVGLPLLAVYCLWLLLGPRVALRRRLALTAAGSLSALALLGGYFAAEHHETGRTGLSRNGIWNLYGRVAPFADCHKFTPPPGTRVLCETTPRSARPLTYQYTFNWYYSPAVRYFDNPHVATADQTRAVADFAWSVIWGQPLDYATEVGAGLLRYVSPGSFEGYGGGPSYDDLVHGRILFNRLFQKEGLHVAAQSYSDAERFSVHRGLLNGLRGYESITRIQGVVFIALALLSLAGPLLARGRTRAAAALFALAAWALMVVPVATVEFSARTAVPGFGPLGAAAAIGGFAVLSALRDRGRSRSSAGGGRGHARAAASA